jgi:hypothetical protein
MLLVSPGEIFRGVGADGDDLYAAFVECGPEFFPSP